MLKLYITATKMRYWLLLFTTWTSNPLMIVLQLYYNHMHKSIFCWVIVLHGYSLHSFLLVDSENVICTHISVRPLPFLHYTLVKYIKHIIIWKYFSCVFKVYKVNSVCIRKLLALLGIWSHHVEGHYKIVGRQKNVNVYSKVTEIL